MVRELLDISRLESSDPLTVSNMDELPLAGIIRNVAEKLSVRCVKHNITINVHADDNIKILGDGDQMVQLIMILCDNALKYSLKNRIAAVFREPAWGLLLPKKLFVSTAPVPR